MYPSKRHPTYGKFVETCVSALRARGVSTDVAAVVFSVSIVGKAMRYLLFWVKANALLLTRSYDCVYVHHPLHVLLLSGCLIRWRRFRLALNFHGDDLLPAKRRGKLLQFLVRRHYSHADTVLLPSTYFKEEFERRFGVRESRAVHIFSSGGVADRYIDGPDMPQSARGRSILFLSRLVEGKGWRLFVELVKVLHRREAGFRATIAGQGEDLWKLEQLILEQGLSRFLRTARAESPEENRNLYATHRYFVFPSLLPESLALVNLEAMACGCVVISTDFPAAREYLREGIDGFRIPTDTFVRDAADIICKLEADPGLVEMMSGRAQVSAEKYRESTVVGALPALLGVT